MKRNSEFRQHHKVGVAGNFINQMMANNDTLPEVGKGATELHYSDRTCYEVIEVSEDFKTVKMECLEAKAARPNLPMGHQEWVFEPTGNFFTLVWRHGAWRVKTEVVRFTKAFTANAEKNGHFATGRALTPEQHTAVYAGDVRPQNVVPGITEKKFEYSKMNILFGQKDYRYDWEF